MSRTIRILPDSVANQIAAGEVVERPASVVKELVENALDARSTSIEVVVEGGGKRRIRVSDDGVGMVREDALLSLDRHATSKIREAAELRSIRSFGFRGEGLPSIAAVSRMRLESRRRGEESGTAIMVEGGTITSVRDTSRRPGTTVEVRNLFFNAPARSKFLKAASGETRAVVDAVVALALANPSTAFAMKSQDRRLLDLPVAADVTARIAALWGDEAAATLIPISRKGESVRIGGLIQRPDAAKPGFRRAHLFVNGRPIKEARFLRVADQAYRTTVAPDVRPWLFLFLETSDGSVDVNVHPTKAEVRFREVSKVETLLEKGVRRSLSTEESAATFDTPPLEGGWAILREGGEKRRGRGGEGETTDRGSQMALFLSNERFPRGAGVEGEGEVEAGTAVEARPARLWQLHDSYILAETREGLLLVDQHSAHERVLFEGLMETFQGEESATGQSLLFPITLRLSALEYERVLELRGLLARSGFELEGFGGDTVIVQAVPNPHPYFDAERCFREMIADLSHGSELVRSARNQHEGIAMTFACKGAIKAGQRLGEAEMGELVDALFATKLPHHDVHGRPTIIRLTKSELERRFGR